MFPTPEMERIEASDRYLHARTGRYSWRCARYDAALDELRAQGMGPGDTICDVGAGWTEFAARLYTLHPRVRPRYFPVDGGLDGTDLELWVPPRACSFFVALELLEHLSDPWRLVVEMQAKCEKAVVISTPNPAVVDVLGMDTTHRTPIGRTELQVFDFTVRPCSFYGLEDDSLLAVWTRKEPRA